MAFKSKYKGSEIENLLDKMSKGGGGITIVDSVDQLDSNAELGSLASVVEPGSIQESSFRDLYQPDASMLDQNTGAFTAPELLSSVSSISVLAPQNVDSIVETGLFLVNRDVSATSLSIAMVGIVPQQGVFVTTITEGEGNMQEFILAEYSQDTMSYTIHNDQVEAFNAVLANGMDWCYFGNPEGGITEEQFATIDLFVKAVAGIPSKAHVYLKNDNWEELYAKDLNKLTSNIDKVEASITAVVDTKADKINVLAQQGNHYPMSIEPNKYYRYKVNSNNQTLNFVLLSSNKQYYEEYIIEVVDNGGISSISFKDSDDNDININWANGLPPTFERGNTYIISIVNGFGVYSTFPNS